MKTRQHHILAKRRKRELINYRHLASHEWNPMPSNPFVRSAIQVVMKMLWYPVIREAILLFDEKSNVLNCDVDIAI